MWPRLLRSSRARVLLLLLLLLVLLGSKLLRGARPVRLLSRVGGEVLVAAHACVGHLACSLAELLTIRLVVRLLNVLVLLLLLLLRRVEGALLTVGSGEGRRISGLLLLLIVVRRCDSLMLGATVGALSVVTLVLAMSVVRAVVRLLSIHALLGTVSLGIREWHTHGHAHVAVHAGVAHRVHHLWVPEAVRTHLMVRHVLLRGGLRLLVARAACVAMHKSAVE